ncbi:glutathione S-transferase zeta class-like isoform X2 [Pistacia vera]|uniref:glutathione S-transferase zeta class-like isoform X2 n=1 Tax=Pistacia vera TaxID=55513 RepID=UPI001262B012|nr:glutathione S-transferase zeta class-like isoform X2 [Pistacia vera]
MWWMMSNEGGHYCSKKSDDICCDVCGQYLIAGLDYEHKAVNLVKEEQNSPEFRKPNPLGYVPVLVDRDVLLSDSFAILLYLAEKYLQHPLLPSDLKTKAINFQISTTQVFVGSYHVIFSLQN